MSANLAVDDQADLHKHLRFSKGLMSPQAVYMAVVRQLARRGFRLGSLLDFWQQLLEGDEYMPRFDPRHSLSTEGPKQVDASKNERMSCLLRF